MSETTDPLDRSTTEATGDESESLEEPDRNRSDEESDSLDSGEPRLVSPPSEGRLFLMAVFSAVVGFSIYVIFEPESGGLVLLCSIAVLIALLAVDGYGSLD